MKKGVQWRIGNGNSIHACYQPWLKNGNNSFVSPTYCNVNYDLKVGDLMDHNTTTSKKDLVKENFDILDAEKIQSIPLLIISESGMSIRKFSPTGDYTVRSAYHNTMENILDTDHLRCEGDLMLIWKLQVPPKIKHFLWRLLRGCLATQSNLIRKNVKCPLTCVCCDVNIENEWHLFFVCDHAQNCWQAAGP